MAFVGPQKNALHHVLDHLGDHHFDEHPDDRWLLQQQQRLIVLDSVCAQKGSISKVWYKREKEKASSVGQEGEKVVNEIIEQTEERRDEQADQSNPCLQLTPIRDSTGAVRRNQTLVKGCWTVFLANNEPNEQKVSVCRANTRVDKVLLLLFSLSAM